jgi:signal transduction histidine kinase
MRVMPLLVGGGNHKEKRKKESQKQFSEKLKYSEYFVAWDIERGD